MPEFSEFSINHEPRAHYAFQRCEGWAMSCGCERSVFHGKLVFKDNRPYTNFWGIGRGEMKRRKWLEK